MPLLQPLREHEHSPSPGLTREIESGKMDRWPAERLIEWGLESFAPRIALAASFGALEGMVILDLMCAIAPERVRVFTVDTGRLPQQTHDLIDTVRDRYGIEVEMFLPDPRRLESMVRAHGTNLFYESVDKRKLCCAIRKVEPFERALGGLDAWISGLRPEQSVTRERVCSVEIDHIHGGRIKLNPLATWTAARVAEYVVAHSVPVNALHARGYPSVGCAPCSRAIAEGEPERAGRWWWEQPEHRECGIHVGYEDQGSGI
jgi:phosphoadenylyl-sulfate reductase (thioredoxin)